METTATRGKQKGPKHTIEHRRKLLKKFNFLFKIKFLLTLPIQASLQLHR